MGKAHLAILAALRSAGMASMSGAVGVGRLGCSPERSRARPAGIAAISRVHSMQCWAATITERTPPPPDLADHCQDPLAPQQSQTIICEEGAWLDHPYIGFAPETLVFLSGRLICSHLTQCGVIAFFGWKARTAGTVDRS
jgi:hypothetical protein